MELLALIVQLSFQALKDMGLGLAEGIVGMWGGVQLVGMEFSSGCEEIYRVSTLRNMAQLITWGVFLVVFPTVAHILYDLSLTDDATSDNRPSAAAAVHHHPSSAINFKSAEEGQDTCCVCLDNIPDCKLTGCHKSTAGGYICGVCADRLVRGSRKCPLCRGNATRYEVVVVEAEAAVVPIQKKEEEIPNAWDE
jgi:hypothetical protein